MAKKMHGKKGHKFAATHIEHHADGSHTVHHVHESTPSKDVKAAVANHAALLDHMRQNTAAMAPDESAAPAQGPAAAEPSMPGAGSGMPMPQQGM